MPNCLWFFIALEVMNRERMYPVGFNLFAYFVYKMVMTENGCWFREICVNFRRLHCSLHLGENCIYIKNMGYVL